MLPERFSPSVLGSPLRLTPSFLHLRGMATQRFPVPSMGDSISEGTILELAKSVGDSVALEEVVALIETDKVTVEVRSPAAGTVTAFFANANDNVLVGADLIEIDVGSTTGAVAAAPAPAAESTDSSTPTPSPIASNTAARIHPGGKPSLISFPKRGALTQQASAPLAPIPATPPAGATSPSPSSPQTVPTKKMEKPSTGVPPDQLPERFRRPLLSSEEMDAIDSGGADYTF